MEEQLQQRINDLREVISWSLENGGLANGQRICLHQEIAGSLKQISAINNDSPYAGIGGYKIPNHLEEKTTHILRVIKDTKWKKQVINY